MFGTARRADFRSAEGWPSAGFAVVDGPEDREHCFSYSLTHGGSDHAESITTGSRYRRARSRSRRPRAFGGGKAPGGKTGLRRLQRANVAAGRQDLR